MITQAFNPEEDDPDNFNPTKSVTISSIVDLVNTGLVPGVGTVTSVGISMPSAFTVGNGSPVTSAGVINISGSGASAQYIDGTGSLQSSELILNRDSTTNSLGNKTIPSNFDFSNIPSSYANSIWNIVHHHDLSSATVTLPIGVVLKTAGGSLSNGTLTGVNTIIEGSIMIFQTNLIVNGTWDSNDGLKPTWFETESDDTNRLQKVFNMSDNDFTVDLQGATFILQSTILLNRNKVVTINGNGATLTTTSGNNGLLFMSISSGTVSCNGVLFDGAQIGQRGVYVTGANLNFYENTFVNFYTLTLSAISIFIDYSVQTDKVATIRNNKITEMYGVTTGSSGDSLGATRAILAVSPTSATGNCKVVIQDNYFNNIFGREGDVMQFTDQLPDGSQSNSRVIVQGNYIGYSNRRGVKAQGNNVTVKNNTFKTIDKNHPMWGLDGQGGAGVFSAFPMTPQTQSDNCIFMDNEVHNNGGIAGSIYYSNSKNGVVQGNVIYNNVIGAATNNFFETQSTCDNIVVTGNSVHTIGNIKLSTNTTNISITHNTFYNIIARAIMDSVVTTPKNLNFSYNTIYWGNNPLDNIAVFHVTGANLVFEKAIISRNNIISPVAETGFNRCSLMFTSGTSLSGITFFSNINTDSRNFNFGTTNVNGCTFVESRRLFKNVEAFKLLSLPNGLVFSTESYYSLLDGGGAEYKVVLSSEYVGTVDGYGDHTLPNGNIAVLQSEIASAKQFGAKDGVESGIHIQSMFNWCAKSTNTSHCILGHNEERFKISKSLILSSRHSGLNFSCKNAWIDIIQGTVSTTALRLMIGEYNNSSTYFAGDALGTTVKDINIDVLNIMSDAPVEEKAIFYLDDVSLLPVNDGDSAAYTTAHSNFQNYFLNNGYSTGGVDVVYSPSLNSSTINLSIDFFKNIKINTCNFVDVARSGINIAAKSDDFNIGTITQNGCIYHPLSTLVPTFFTTNVDFIINLNVGDINVENTNSIFDFSAETKDSPIPHGYINIERAIGRKIRGRTKIHGNYHEISIGLLDSEQQTGGQLIGNWAVLSFLEGIKLYIDKIISRSASYNTANGVLYIGDVDNAYGNRQVLINNSISYLPEITNNNTAQSIFYDQNTNVISFTNKYTIKNIEVFGVLPIVLNSLKGHVTIWNINIYSSSVSNRVLSNALINNASLFLSISKLYVDFLTFNTATSSLITFINDTQAPLKVLNIGDVVIGDASGVDSGVLVTTQGQMPDISIGSIITPAALSLRCLARTVTADGNRCGILMVANSITDAGVQYPVENPQYLVFAENQFITGQAKPALVWWDSQNLALKYNLDRPTSEVDGTNV